MSYYNHQYTYPDMYLWQDETWADRESVSAPVFKRLGELIEERRKEKGSTDHFEGRQDETRDEVNHEPYFSDVVDEWKKKGMYFSSYGMMGELMAPTAVEKHELYDARVVFIPVMRHFGEPHEAMNLLVENADFLEYAAKENILVQFIDCRRALGGGMQELGIETQGTFKISYKPVYLDISVLYENGESLMDISGLELSAWDEPIQMGNRTVVEITDKWQISLAHQYSISRMYIKNLKDWDYDRHIRSVAGKHQAEGMRLEYAYEDCHDPKMDDFWKEKGIRYEDHYYGHDWYVTLTPECVFEQPEHKIPLFIILKEPRTAIPGMMQTAFQFYYDFIDICARGEFMMLYFALETPWDNDEVLPDIVKEVFSQYPVDQSRVYITGQSHNGCYALEFYRKHPKMIAAAATLCDPVGLRLGARVDYAKTRAQELIDNFRAYDYPLININGTLENHYNKRDRSPQDVEDDVFYFQNRMKAWKHKVFSREEILSAKDSKDYATSQNGVPADRTEVRYVMGSEAYVSDYQDENGKWYLRYISLENTPHMIMPQMAELSWEYVRRFARDTETGETIELY